MLGFEPAEVTSHLKAVSLALTGIGRHQPILGRGPMKAWAIRQFLRDVIFFKIFITI